MNEFEYISEWTGEEIDRALRTLIDSQITTEELERLHGTNIGTVEGGKVVVVNEDKVVGTFKQLNALTLGCNILNLGVQSTDPEDVPETGTVFMYLKGTVLTLKLHDGSILTYKANRYYEETFENVNQITILHEWGTYPQVLIIGTNNEELTPHKEYTSLDTVVVSFKNLQSGLLILRA